MFVPDIFPAPQNITQYIHNVNLYKAMSLICYVPCLSGLNNKHNYHADKTKA